MCRPADSIKSVSRFVSWGILIQLNKKQDICAMPRPTSLRTDGRFMQGAFYLMTQFPEAPRLPDDVLAKRHLPLKPAPVTLEGKIVRLVPLDLARDLEALYAVSNGQPATLGDRSIEEYDADALIWRYMGSGPFASADEMAKFLQPLIDAPDVLPMCVFEQTPGHQVGIATLMSNVPASLKIDRKSTRLNSS